MAVDIAFTVIVALGLIAGLVTVYYAIRLPFHGQSQNLHGWFKLNPFNAIFSPGRLTARGLLVRRRLLLAAGTFLACAGLGTALGLLARSLG